VDLKKKQKEKKECVKKRGKTFESPNLEIKSQGTSKPVAVYPKYLNTLSFMKNFLETSTSLKWQNFKTHKSRAYMSFNGKLTISTEFNSKSSIAPSLNNKITVKKK